MPLIAYLPLPFPPNRAPRPMACRAPQDTRGRPRRRIARAARGCLAPLGERPAAQRAGEGVPRFGRQRSCGTRRPLTLALTPVRGGEGIRGLGALGLPRPAGEGWGEGGPLFCHGRRR